MGTLLGAGALEGYFGPRAGNMKQSCALKTGRKTTYEGQGRWWCGACDAVMGAMHTVQAYRALEMQREFPFWMFWGWVAWDAVMGVMHTLSLDMR